MTRACIKARRAARQSWDSVAAGLSVAAQVDLLARELDRADSALALNPRSRRWRKYRADCFAQIRAIDPAPADIAALSVDELAAALAAE